MTAPTIPGGIRLASVAPDEHEQPAENAAMAIPQETPAHSFAGAAPEAANNTMQHRLRLASNRSRELPPGLESMPYVAQQLMAGYLSPRDIHRLGRTSRTMLIQMGDQFSRRRDGHNLLRNMRARIDFYEPMTSGDVDDILRQIEGERIPDEYKQHIVNLLANSLDRIPEGDRAALSNAIWHQASGMPHEGRKLILESLALKLNNLPEEERVAQFNAILHQASGLPPEYQEPILRTLFYRIDALPHNALQGQLTALRHQAAAIGIFVG